jgi:hypothetical protein
MRTIDDLERWKSYGFVMTPAEADKQPRTVNKKWCYTWSFQELMAALRLGVYHDPSNVFTIDFDDDSYTAHKYLQLLPDTFTDGRIIGGNRIPTHRTYKLNGQGAPTIGGAAKYPKRVSKKKGLLVEVLTGKHTIFTGGDRFIWLDVPPAEVDNKSLEKKLKLICFFTEVEKVFPAKGGRDEAHLRLAGALAKLPVDEYPDELLQEFQEQLCINTGDNEFKNRTRKINYQRKQLANGKKVYGITELRAHLDSELEAYNLLFEQKEEELPQDTDPDFYPLIDGSEFDLIEYPKVDYIQNPIFSTRSFNQIYGWYESGKTIFGLACSIAMASGQKFLDWECDTPTPSIYVESELPGDVFRGYRSSILQGYLNEGKQFNSKNHFTLNQDDLTRAGFKYGFKSIAVAKAHGKDAAKDYGRKGREIFLDLFMKIKERTGKFPFYFLDNMSRLATFDENKQPDWEPFINWGIDLKNKGIPGCFLHHANKGGQKGSSGSSYIGRLLDTSIQLTKLEDDYRFPMPGNKNLQSSIRFDKSRGFGGSSWANKRILTMNEDGQWKHYPFLKQISFVILGLAKQGHTQEEIREMAKNNEVRDRHNEPYSSSHVDKLYKELVTLKLIDKDRKTVCWNCKEPISTEEDGSCGNCGTGIPCTACGKCICEKPKKNKKGGFKWYDEEPY